MAATTSSYSITMRLYTAPDHGIETIPEDGWDRLAAAGDDGDGARDGEARPGAHSEDADQQFQRIPISHSDRSRSVWRGCVSAPLDAFLISVFSPDVKHC